eukprot:TRINITY_DN65621_c9_g3_i1.p1 TRINITY_DN65621_c9_g3~~TRINITY_DN65621_c9_g3_i1.p1  ORF type:complete len:424 (-),score=27.58 TRINITY_DN65621_c9_g3_i1:1554-2825(-)
MSSYLSLYMSLKELWNDDSQASPSWQHLFDEWATLEIQADNNDKINNKKPLRAALVQDDSRHHPSGLRPGPQRDSVISSSSSGCHLPFSYIDKWWAWFKNMKTNGYADTIRNKNNDYHQTDNPWICGRNMKSWNCLNKIYVGFILKWQADYVVWSSSLQSNSRCSSHINENYDVLLFIDRLEYQNSFPKKSPKHNQVRIWMPIEPPTVIGVGLKDEFPGICPVAVNSHLFPTMPLFGWDDLPLHFRYDVEAFTANFKVATNNKGNNVVWLPEPQVENKRQTKEIVVALKQMSLKPVLGDGGHQRTTLKNYFDAIAHAKFVILPNLIRHSSGQIIADASMFGVPAFARKERCFSRVTQHPSLIWNKTTLLVQAIHEMVSTPGRFEEMQAFSFRSRWNLDYRTTPSLDRLLALLQAVSPHPNCRL